MICLTSTDIPFKDAPSHPEKRQIRMQLQNRHPGNLFSV